MGSCPHWSSISLICHLLQVHKRKQGAKNCHHQGLWETSKAWLLELWFH